MDGAGARPDGRGSDPGARVGRGLGDRAGAAGADLQAVLHDQVARLGAGPAAGAADGGGARRAAVPGAAVGAGGGRGVRAGDPAGGRGLEGWGFQPVLAKADIEEGLAGPGGGGREGRSGSARGRRRRRCGGYALR